MVAVITGNGLGLGNTSLTQLGQAQGGSPSLGQAANNSYVNTATGNLVLQSQDEGVLFDGLSLNVLRTYNSLGQLSSNGWSYGFSRNLNGLTGTLNTAGSTITRTDDDGSSVVYSYNASLGVYVSTAQSGAVDTLSWNATSSTWTYTDAADNAQETYNATGQLTALTDMASGASYSFSYSNGQLSQIVAADGDTLIFGYNTSNQLISLSIQEVPPGQSTAVTRQAVTYGYDSQGRLSTVTTTLASDTDSTTASYTTTYGYQGTTDLVASVTQSDGTTVSYTYTQDAQGAYQVTGITSGTGAAAQSVTLSYGSNSTTITDGLGNVTTYQTNAAGELTSVIAPTVNGVSPTTHYTYDANGNLLTSTDPDGNVTSYSYDVNGNLLSVEDGAGNTVSYTYNSADQVTSKTTYTVPAQGEVGQSGYVAPSGAQTTYYVYTATNQLAYTVDPLGNVSENDYTTVNGLSELTTSRQYLGATYNVSTNTNSPSSLPTLAQLQAWVQSSAVQTTLAQSTRTDYSYDIRGQLAMQTQYDTVNSSGVGVVDAGTVITTTTYDAQGRLLQTSAETGANRTTLQTTSYTYDGLGRVISKTDPLGHVTSYVYTDSANTIAITQANGLTTTQVRNSAGQLLSSTQSASGLSSRVTSYLYNADGEPVAAIDANGDVSYTFTNADGEVTGTVDGDGNVTAYTYDADGRVLSTTHYATQVNTSAWLSGGALTSSYPTSLPVPVSTANDRTTTSIYNAAGEVVAKIDPAGNVTTFTYDGTGNVLSQTQYATPLSSTVRNTLGSNLTLTALQNDLASNANNRTTLTIYDADGHAVATVDALGYVTITSYNAAGEAVLSTAYATALTSKQLGTLGDTPTLAALQADITTGAQDQTTRSYYDGAGGVVAQIDADGYLTAIGYDETTDTTTTTRYATALSSTQLAALTGTETVAALIGLLGSNTANETSSVTANADGQVTSRTAVDGTVTTYTYNTVGQVLSATVTPVSGQGTARTTSATYDAFGDTLTATDAAGATTTYQYSALGQRTEVTDALGNSTWSYFDADGKLLYTIQGQPSSNTRNALGNVTAYAYNAFGEVSSTTTYAASLTLITTGTNSGTSINPTGATSAQVATAIAALSTVSGDANATASSTFTLDGQVATMTDGDGYQTASTYDAFGDVLSVQQQLSQPGSALSSSNSTTTTYTYDARGEQLSETDGVGTSVARTTSETYDAFGRVTSATDGNGNTVTYSYDNLGRQVSTSQMVQGSARTTQTTYDAFGNTLTETDVLGNVTTVSTNLATHTTTVTTPLGVTMTTVKDAFGDTVSVTDGGGNTTTYTYDADGRLLTTTTPLGEVSSNQYDADGNRIQTTDATGHVVTYTYNASGKVLTQTVDPTSVNPSGLNLTTSYAYDAQGRTLSVTDPTGVVTTYRYDAAGNTLSKVTDATGLALTTTYTYDGNGKTLTVTTGSGTSAAVTIQYVYDNLERLSQTIVAPGSLNLTTNYSYDANDNLVASTDANGNVTRYLYDQANEKIFTIDPTGAVTQNTYDADGRLTATRTYTTVPTASALGNPPTLATVTAAVTAGSADSYTQRVYNADGQLTYVLNGTGLNATQYTYNSAGQVTQTRQYATAPSSPSSISTTATATTVAGLLTTSANDLVTTTAYNADGEAVYTIDGAGDVTQAFYDAAGRVTKTTAYATALTGTKLTGLGSTPTAAQVAAVITTSASDRSSFTSYDTAGRAVYRVNALGTVTQTTYDADGRVTSTHVYATALTSTQLSGLGNAPTPTQLGGLVSASSTDPVSYRVYDSAGELRYSIDPMGYVTEVRYDATGKAVETLAYASAISTTGETSALQAGTALGWISTQVGGTSSNPDSSAQATLSLYDAAGRLAYTVQQNGSAAQVTGYTDDANGNVLSTTAYGSTLAVSAGTALSAQFTTASVASAVAGFTAKHTALTVYDADNRALYTIDALGDVTQYSYDGNGRLIETQQYANPIVLPATVNASTVAAAITAAGGTTSERLASTTYNSLGQVLTTSDALGVNATYTYNALGQKASYANRDGDTWHYSYDSAGRLVQTQSPQVTVASYSGNLSTTANQYLYTTTVYDAFGEVLSTSQGYGASASSITNAATTGYAYDALGHRIQATHALGHSSTTTYNELGQAVVTTDANGHHSYSVYNADGQLIDSIDGNGYLTAYTYDAYGNVLTTTQYATALNTAVITGWSAGQPLSTAQVQQGLTTSSNDRTTTISYNQLNQKTQVVLPSIGYEASMGALAGAWATGSPTTTYTYDAYGNVTSASQLVQGAFASGSTTTPAIWATTYTYYDALNRAVMVVTPTGSSTSPQGYVTTTAYTAFGQVNSTTQYALAISTSGIVTTIPPALPGVPTQTAGANRTTSYTYDAIGRVQTETDTGAYYYTGGTLGQLNGNLGWNTASSVTSYTYNGENQVLTETVNGATTTTQYDALGRVLTVTAPARQVLVSNWQSLLTGTPTDDLTTAALSTTVSPVTSYLYDALGDAVSTTLSAGALTQQTYASYNALGQVTTNVDAGSNVHTTTYDNNGNVLTQSYTLTAGVTVTTTNAYDADNQLLSTAVQRSNASTYDSYTQQKYNAFGEVIAKGDNNGYEAQYGYNNAGQQNSATSSTTGAIHSYGYDLIGNLVTDDSTITGGSATVWTFNIYNLSNEVVSEVTPATNAASGENTARTSMSYDRWGNLISATDANGNTTTYQYDSQNHLIEETEATVTVVSQTGAYSTATPTKTWNYNVDGELMESTDENGAVTKYTYDAVGKQLTMVDGTGATTTTAYDALGRAVSTETPPVLVGAVSLSNITYTNYNALNQVIEQGDFQLNSASSARTQVMQGRYTYNINGDRLTSMDALGNTTTYTYDSQHRILTSTTPLSEKTIYTYDVNGNLIAETDADGHTQSWTYNYFKQVLKHIDESGATYNYTYDASSGLMTQETSNWNGTTNPGAVTSTLTFNYDADGALAGLTEVVTGVATSTYGYGYDADGNEVMESANTTDGNNATVKEQTNIVYDSHNRLEEVTEINTATNLVTARTVYVYDAVGNRRAVFTSNGYDSQGSSSTPINATPISTVSGGPTVGSGMSVSTTPGQSFNYTVPSSAFNDNLGFGLTYSASGMPSWMSFNASTRTFSGTPPTPLAANTTYSVTVTAMDVAGNKTNSTLTVTIPLVPPVFTAGASSHTVSYNSTFSFSEPGATSPNGLTPSYSASYWNGSAWAALPSWISFNASTLTFSGTPPIGSAGNYTLAVWSSVPGSGAVANQFTLTVPALVAPTFTSGGANHTVMATEGFSFSEPGATDSQGFGVSYSASYYNGSAWVALPSWISFNASTLTFSGTPPAGTSGTFSFAVWAGAAGQISGNGFTLTVQSATPVYNGSGIVISFGGADSSYTWTMPAGTFTNPTGRPLTYTLTGQVPPYTVMSSSGVLTYGRANPYVVKSLSPDSAPGGNYYYYPTLTATDPVSGLSVSITITILITGTVNPAVQTAQFASTPASTPAPIPTPAPSLATQQVASPDLIPIGGTGGGTGSPTPTPTPTPSSPTPTPSSPTPTPTPAPSPAPNVQANWFTYDADGRVLIANGSLESGQIVFTTELNSGQNSYDLAGDLTTYTSLNSSGQTIQQKGYYNVLGEQTLLLTQTTTNGAFYNYEQATYDADGHQLTQVMYNLPGSEEAGTYSGNTINFSDAGWVRTDTIYTYNVDGELIDQSEYDEEAAQTLINQYGTGVASSSYATSDQTAPTSLPGVGAGSDGDLLLSAEYAYQGSGNGYDGDGNLLGYQEISTANATVNHPTATSATTDTFRNTYLLQNSLLASATTETTTASSETATTLADTYNDLGELVTSVSNPSGTPDTYYMAYTADDQLLQKNSQSTYNNVNYTYTAFYLYANQQALGNVNNNGSINMLATTGGFTNSSLGSQNYTVQVGDTLQSIAQEIYGDSDYSYILAEANGLSAGSALPIGMVLHIPQITTSANNANTYQPYAQGVLATSGAGACETTAQIVAASVETVLSQQAAFAQTVATIEQEQAKYVAAVEKELQLKGTLSYAQAQTDEQNFKESIVRMLSRFRESLIWDAIEQQDSIGFNDTSGDDSGTFLVGPGGETGYVSGYYGSPGGVPGTIITGSVTSPTGATGYQYLSGVQTFGVQSGVDNTNGSNTGFTNVDSSASQDTGGDGFSNVNVGISGDGFSDSYLQGVVNNSISTYQFADLGNGPTSLSNFLNGNQTVLDSGSVLNGSSPNTANSSANVTSLALTSTTTTNASGSSSSYGISSGGYSLGLSYGVSSDGTVAIGFTANAPGGSISAGAASDGSGAVSITTAQTSSMANGGSSSGYGGGSTTGEDDQGYLGFTPSSANGFALNQLYGDGSSSSGSYQGYLGIGLSTAFGLSAGQISGDGPTVDQMLSNDPNVQAAMIAADGPNNSGAIDFSKFSSLSSNNQTTGNLPQINIDTSIPMQTIDPDSLSPLAPLEQPSLVNVAISPVIANDSNDGENPGNAPNPSGSGFRETPLTGWNRLYNSVNADANDGNPIAFVSRGILNVVGNTVAGLQAFVSFRQGNGWVGTNPFTSEQQMGVKAQTNFIAGAGQVGMMVATWGTSSAVTSVEGGGADAITTGAPNPAVTGGVRIATEQPAVAGQGTSDLLNQIRESGGTLPVARGQVTVQDIAAASKAGGNEVAYFRDRATGQLYLRELGPQMGEIPTNSRLILHTQPGEGFLAVQPSSADRAALTLLNQRSSVIVNSEGTFAIRFRPLNTGDGNIQAIGDW